MSVLKSLATAAVFTLALSAGGAAFAKERAVDVSIAGVDFSNPAEVDTLHMQLAQAARAVCPAEGRLSLQQTRQRNACIRVSLDRAVAQADIPSLTVLHANLGTAQKYAAYRAPADSAVLQLAADAGAGQGRSAGKLPR